MPGLRAQLTAALLGFFLLAGCGENEARFGRRPITIDKIPPEILASAKKQLPGYDLQDAWTNHADGKTEIHSYEIRGQNTAGKTREVRVGLDGTILEEE